MLDQAHLSELTLNLTLPSLASLLERELCACPSDFRRLQWLKAPAFTAAASVRRRLDVDLLLCVPCCSRLG